MAGLDFTPQQLRELRKRLGLHDSDPDPTPGAVVAIITAAGIIEAEAERLGLQ